MAFSRLSHLECGRCGTERDVAGRPTVPVAVPVLPADGRLA
ncbi:hypothetical protein [Actinomadura nitritigenes]